MAKRKVISVQLLGTGVNETFYALSHEIVAYPASTYHKFTYTNGVVVWKNDFGVSQVIVTPAELPEGKEL
jgi:hypothetical protein